MDGRHNVHLFIVFFLFNLNLIILNYEEKIYISYNGLNLCLLSVYYCNVMLFFVLVNFLTDLQFALFSTTTWKRRLRLLHHFNPDDALINIANATILPKCVASL